MKHFSCRTLIIIVLSFLIIVSASITAFAFVQAPPSGVNVYTVVPFEELYAAGYLNLHDGTSHGSINTTDQHYVSNTSRQAGTYIDWPNGAVLNGEYLDVRDFPNTFGSLDNTTGSGVYLSGGTFCTSGGCTHGVRRELHFYTAGHCGDPNYERDFYGIMRLTDNDGQGSGTLTHDVSREGYRFPQGLHNVWLANPTSMELKSSSEFWGTEDYGPYDERGVAWVEVEAHPGAPLIFEYCSTNGGYGSDANYMGNSIHYSLRSDGLYPLPAGATIPDINGCATYGSYRFINPPDIYGWAFDGWYSDYNMTSKLGDTTMITSDITVYGTYHRTIFGVSTSVTNGSITATNNNIPIGSNHTVSYSPSSGYLLQSVTVDGAAQSISSCPSSYTFYNVQADHSISVAYAAPSASKSASPSSVTAETSTNDKTTYTISFTNPTPITRTVVITDPIPANTTVSSINNGGSQSGNNVTWTTTVAANSTASVSWVARNEYAAANSTVTNTASVVFKKIAGSSENDVSLSVSASNTVIRNPILTTSCTNGTISDSNSNVHRGSNVTVSYAPNSGYLLYSVTVDGSSVDIGTYPDNYTFVNYQDDHSVSTVYVAPTAGKTWALTISG